MAKTGKAKKSKPESNSKYFLIIAFILLGAVVVYFSFFSKDEKEFRITDRTERPGEIQEPQFVKEGELEFFKKDGKQPVKKIDVEIADNDKERTQGMMFRSAMDADKGMLFIFDREEMQGFWMKNTLIPLDIMFVNSKNEIVKIHKNTVPYSERTLPSESPSIYVVEVNGGFSDRFGIMEGDLISFNRSRQ